MFQSSPTPKGGRYARDWSSPSSRKCFNPRPPRKVGATSVSRNSARQQGVSILAHPERWALRNSGVVMTRSIKFQSSPTPKGGRYRRKRGTSCRIESFNPRPPRKVGATDVSSFLGKASRVSILAHPERWALRRSGLPRATLSVFQSSPTPKGGRYNQNLALEEGYYAVSILAHPERWALRRPAPTRRAAGPGFNPRPPRKVGATEVHPGQGAGACVSILAHPERWALPVIAVDNPGLLVFQSSPTPKGGRYARGRAGPD